MSKKTAHVIIFLGDLLCLWGLWIGFNEIKGIFNALHSQADIIRVGSRVGFYIMGIFLPVTHIFIVANSFIPVIERKYSRLVNQCFAVAIIVLLASGFIGSHVIRKSVANAGYTYCREASGLSTLVRTLVYTKTMDICEKETQKKVAKKF